MTQDAAKIFVSWGKLAIACPHDGTILPFAEDVLALHPHELVRERIASCPTCQKKSVDRTKNP